MMQKLYAGMIQKTQKPYQVISEEMLRKSYEKVNTKVLWIYNRKHMSLTFLIDEWIVDNRVRARRGFSHQTERAYRNDLATFARVYADLEERELPKTDEDDPWAKQNQQLARISTKDLTDKNIAQVFTELIELDSASSSRGRLLSALRGFCGWLFKHGHINSDPTIDFETPQVEEKLPVAFNEQQLKNIFEVAATPDKRLRVHWPKRDIAIIGVLAGCGLRSSELTTLTIAGIDRQEPYRVRVTGKGNKDRVIPLSAEVLNAIDKYLEERKERKLGGEDKDSYLFVRTNGKQINNQALQNLVTNWLGAAAVPIPKGEKAHAFRHTYAVSQLDHGTNPAELQTLLGHKNLATTSQYLRLSAEGLHHTARATAVNNIISEIKY